MNSTFPLRRTAKLRPQGPQPHPRRSGPSGRPGPLSSGSPPPPRPAATRSPWSGSPTPGSLDWLSFCLAHSHLGAHGRLPCLLQVSALSVTCQKAFLTIAWGKRPDLLSPTLGSSQNTFSPLSSVFVPACPLGLRQNLSLVRPGILPILFIIIDPLRRLIINCRENY